MRPALLLLFALPLAAQSPPSTAETRGKQIFERGVSSSGAAIDAVIGSGTAVSASILPCANCHGRDGLGRPEGGIVPANVTWDVLTKPYKVARAGGSARSPYNERLVKRAIAMGMDSDGNSLNAAMPHYQMSMTDAADLIAYLKVLGQTADPGLTATSVRLGVLVTPGPAGEAMKQALDRHFAEINRQGGIFGRNIETIPLDLPADPAKRADVLREFVARGVAFAVCGDFDGAESDLGKVLRDAGMPGLAIFASSPDLGVPLNPYVFYLDDGATPQSADSGRDGWNRATAAAEIVAEALRRAGRTLSRSNFIATLEGFYRVATSLGTPVSFDPNRRVGSGK